jgi:DNA-binding beta-propeller fold protein YncE
MKHLYRSSYLIIGISLITGVVVGPPTTAIGGEPQSFLPNIIISSTIPGDGDLNPYGVAFVPPGFRSGGPLAPGDILVSNFNNFNNAQGTGTTIIKLTPNGLVAPAVPAGQPGNASTFFQGSGLGLTTALGVLTGGFVLVGNVPTSGGVIQQGSLLILDRKGKQIASSPLTNGLLNDPWDLTIVDQFDHARVFVSNVNNTATPQKNGTVTRLTLKISGTVTVTSITMIASGYTVEPNSAALVLGPTGLAYDKNTDTLYVASTADNAIFAVPNAATRGGHRCQERGQSSSRTFTCVGRWHWHLHQMAI